MLIYGQLLLIFDIFFQNVEKTQRRSKHGPTEKVNPLSHPDNTNIEAARHEKVPERHASEITPDLQLQDSKFRTRIQ
jgi:hypothetical protein